MRLGSISFPSGRRWWWLFALLIAAPALALALLGLRVAQLERMESAQRVREQQAQLARLADTSISNMLAGLRSELTRAEASPTALRDYSFFILEIGGRLVFPRDKTYLLDPSKPEFRTEPQWEPKIEQLIERAQAAEAQGRAGEAASLFAQVGKAESRLRAWSELAQARIEFEHGDAARLTVLANPLWSTSGGVTPKGLPVALLAAANVEGAPAPQRARFAPLLRATLNALDAGRWWFSLEERRFYEQELRRLAELAGLPPSAEDPKLAEWTAIERSVRRYRPSEDSGPSDPDPAAPFLVLWSRRADGGWLGTAIRRAQLTALIDASLDPLLSNQPFGLAVRLTKGQAISSKAAPGTPVASPTPLRAVAGWEFVFSAPSEGGALDPRRLLWYGFTLVVVATLGVGVVMTIYVVRRELELSRLQSDFVAGVTHEFKSPITSIRLLIERLAGGRLRTAAAAGEYYDAVNRETDRLERLVNRVLESQKIQSGEKRYSFVLGSLVELAESSIWRLRPQAEAKNIGVHLELAGEIPEIRMDTTAVSDALDNLLDNAVKYSPKGSQVVIRVEKRERLLCVEVEDQGIGIDADDLPRIFDRFYRGRRGDQQNVHGTGLGLALVKAAAEGHGGSVEVTSAPGQGARFCLRLPLEK